MTPTPDFVIDEDWCNTVPALSYGDGGTSEGLKFWFDTWRSIYKGNEGRKKARMTILSLVERDGLLWRLSDVKVPVQWLHVSSSGPSLTLNCLLGLVDSISSYATDTMFVCIGLEGCSLARFFCY